MTVISHTPTDRLRVCTAMKKKHGVRESRRVKRSSAREFTGRFAGLGHAVEERDDGDPPRRGKRVFFCQALPRRGWVAPRRPGINKPTARPSPALGPAWPLPAEVSRMLERRRTPTSRRGARAYLHPRRASPRANPRRHGVAASRRAPVRFPQTTRTLACVQICVAGRYPTAATRNVRRKNQRKAYIRGI